MEVRLDQQEGQPAADYKTFYRQFSRLEAAPVVASLEAKLLRDRDPKEIGRTLIRALCYIYAGRCDPTS